MQYIELMHFTCILQVLLLAFLAVAYAGYYRRLGYGYSDLGYRGFRSFSRGLGYGGYYGNSYGYRDFYPSYGYDGYYVGYP